MAGRTADTAALVATLELKDKFSRSALNAEKALGRLETRTSTIGRIGDETGRGLRTAGANLARFGTIAAVGVGGGLVAATKAAIDFEDAFAGIRKTVDEADLAAAGLTFDDLSDSIRGMAREIPIAATELAAIGEAAGALGIAGGDIEEFTRVVAELGVTTDLTSETAAMAMGHLGTILGLTGQEFEDLADSLVALGNDGASTESQIIAITERFAASGKSAGLATEDILALASTAASMGIEMEAAGSSLSRVFDSVTTNIGTSNSKAKAFAESLGLSAEEFREAWEKDALGTFQEFLGVLDELDQFEAAGLLKRVGITGVRDIRAIKLLAGGMEELNDQLETSRSATGALGEEAAKKFETTASQIQLMKNNLTDVGITIGSAVLPKITEMTGKFADFLNQDDVQAAIKEFAAGIPGVIDDLVEIAKGIPWGAIGSAATLMGQGAKALLQAFTSLPPWIQTAVLTGWGLNKLTGGALGGIGKIIGQSVFGRLRGTTPANPVFTKEVGIPGVGGGAPAAGIPAAAVGSGALAGAAALGAGIALPFLMFNVLPELFKVAGAKPVSAQRTFDDGTVVKLDPTQTAMMTGLMPSFQAAVKETGGEIVDATEKVAARVGATDESIDDTRDQVRDLQNPIKGLASVQQRVESAIHGTAAGTARHLNEIKGIERTTAGYTAQVAAKDFSPSFTNNTNVSINLQAQITAYGISRALSIQQSASQTSFTGRGGDSRF